MKTKIIIDSTTDVRSSLKKEFACVPMVVRFGDEEYYDGVTIDHELFYEKLASEKTLPKTSQATPNDYFKVFEKLGADEDAVVITLAGKLSGTYQSAVAAASEYENIYVVDSENVTIGAGILAEYALQLAERGLSAKEVAEELERKKKDVVLVALVDTLEYLYRGGRLSRTAAFAGTLLNIKPVLSVTGGELHVLGKARGSKQGNNLLDKQIEQAGGIDFNMPIMLGYSGLSDELLKKYIEDSKRIWEGKTESLEYESIGSVIGTHAGPGAIAVAFFKKGE